MPRMGSRFDYKPGKHRPKTVRTGAIAVALTSIFLYTIYTRPSVPFLSGGGQELKAEFAFGANVRPGYTPVRVHGVEVGQVTKIVRAPSGRGAIVTMKLKKGEDVGLKTDVRAALRWRTLLGRNLYVDLDPGSPSAPKWPGGTIPKSRTTDQVELDTALEPLDAKGRTALATMITEFDKGFADPAAVRAAIGSPKAGTGAAGAMQAAAGGLPGLRGMTAGKDLPALVANASRVLGLLSHDEVALGGLVDHGAGALGVTAARSADLASTLNTAPGAMRETRATLKRLETTLDAVDPLADELQPGLDELPAAAARTQRTLTVLRPLLSDLRPTLADLRPALSDLRTASNAGVPSFDPLNHTMALVQDKYIPFLKAKDPATHRPNYTNIGPTAASAGAATTWGDRYGALANFEAAAGPDALNIVPCKLGIFNPDTQKKLTCALTQVAAASAVTGKAPDLFKLAGAGLKGLSLDTLKQYITGNKLLSAVPKLTAAAAASLKKGR
jgi:ABC-type transporter Mla subunit MlaD